MSDFDRLLSSGNSHKREKKEKKKREKAEELKKLFLAPQKTSPSSKKPERNTTCIPMADIDSLINTSPPKLGTYVRKNTDPPPPRFLCSDTPDFCNKGAGVSAASRQMQQFQFSGKGQNSLNFGADVILHKSTTPFTPVRSSRGEVKLCNALIADGGAPATILPESSEHRFPMLKEMKKRLESAEQVCKNFIRAAETPTKSGDTNAAKRFSRMGASVLGPYEPSHVRRMSGSVEIPKAKAEPFEQAFPSVSLKDVQPIYSIPPVTPQPLLFAPLPPPLEHSEIRKRAPKQLPSFDRGKYSKQVLGKELFEAWLYTIDGNNNNNNNECNSKVTKTLANECTLRAYRHSTRSSSNNSGNSSGSNSSSSSSAGNVKGTLSKGMNRAFVPFPYALPPMTGQTDMQGSFFRDPKGTMGSILGTLAQPNVTHSEALLQMNSLIEISQVVFDVSLYASPRSLVKTLRPFLLSRISVLRLACLRAIKGFMKVREVAVQLKQTDTHFFIARELFRDKTGKYDTEERDEALVIVRLSVPLLLAETPKSYIQALCSIISTAVPKDADPFIFNTLETLCEMSILATKPTSECNGFRALVKAAINPTFRNYAVNIANVLLTIYTSKPSRNMLFDGELLRLFAAFLIPKREIAPHTSSLNDFLTTEPPPAFQVHAQQTFSSLSSNIPIATTTFAKAPTTPALKEQLSDQRQNPTTPMKAAQKPAQTAPPLASSSRTTTAGSTTPATATAAVVGRMPTPTGTAASPRTATITATTTATSGTQSALSRKILPAQDIEKLTDIMSSSEKLFRYQCMCGLCFLRSALQKFSGVTLLNTSIFGTLFRFLPTHHYDIIEHVLRVLMESVQISIPDLGSDEELTKMKDLDTIKHFLQAHFYVEEETKTNTMSAFRTPIYVSMIHNGVLECLVDIGLNDEAENGAGDHGANAETTVIPRRRVQLLALVFLGEILSISTRLPYTLGAKVQSLPELIVKAAKRTPNSANALTVIDYLLEYHKAKSRTINYDQRVQEIKRECDWGLTFDAVLKKISESRVLDNKDPLKWNWVLINELAEGALTNSALSEYASSVGFYKRVFAFFMPKEKQYSRLSLNDENERYMRCLFLIISSMLGGSPEMEQILTNFLSQVAEEFGQFNAELQRLKSPKEPGEQKSPKGSDERGWLSAATVSSAQTMFVSYFEIIGFMCASERGLYLVTNAMLFPVLVELEQNTDSHVVIRLILNAVKYKLPPAGKVLLELAYEKSSPHIMVSIIKTLENVVENDPEAFKNSIGIIFRLLGDFRISRKAFSLLCRACEKEELIDAILDFMKDQAAASKKKDSEISFDQFKQFAPDSIKVVYRFFSRDRGVMMFQTQLEALLKRWWQEDAVAFQLKTDELIATATKTTIEYPPHLLGELARCEQGCNIVENRGYMDTLVGVVTDPRSFITVRRAALFTLGVIGSSEMGFSRLVGRSAHSATFETVLAALQAPNLSLRESAYFAITLFAHSDAGRRALRRSGWAAPLPDLELFIPFPELAPQASTSTPLPKTRSIDFARMADHHVPIGCFSNHFIATKLLTVPRSPWSLRSTHTAPPLVQFGDARDRILEEVQHLMNRVSEEAAMKALTRLRSTVPQSLFFSPLLARQIFVLLQEVSSFTPGIRKKIFFLFTDGIPQALVPNYFKQFIPLPRPIATFHHVSYDSETKSPRNDQVLNGIMSCAFAPSCAKTNSPIIFSGKHLSNFSQK